MSEELKETQTSEVTDQTTAEVPENKPEVQTVTMTQEEFNAVIAREKGRVKNMTEFLIIRAWLRLFRYGRECAMESRF